MIGRHESGIDFTPPQADLQLLVHPLERGKAQLRSWGPLSKASRYTIVLPQYPIALLLKATDPSISIILSACLIRSMVLKMAPQSTYVLHYDIYSICSSMVRLTFELRGVPRSQDDEMILEERWVDITVGKQLEEDFLVNVNPKGQVSFFP